MNKDNEELRKLIQENPNLPLVFNIYTDNIDIDYYCQVFEGTILQMIEVMMTSMIY